MWNGRTKVEIVVLLLYRPEWTIFYVLWIVFGSTGWIPVESSDLSVDRGLSTLSGQF